jgi:hypothetical protein
MLVVAAVVVEAHMRCIVVEVVAVAGALQLVRSQNMGPLENTQTHCRLMPDVDLVVNHKLRWLVPEDLRRCFEVDGPSVGAWYIVELVGVKLFEWELV